MRLVDSRLRPAVNVDSKSIESYYQQELLPQLRQSGGQNVPLAEVVRKDQGTSYPEENQPTADRLAAKPAGRKPDPRRSADRRTRGPGPMSETGAKPARRKIWKFLLWLMLAGALAAGWAWAGTAPRSPFASWCARRLIATLEHMTGGRVELGSIHIVPFHFQLEVRDLTIHGREQPGEVPYAHVNSLMAQIKIWSLLRTELGLELRGSRSSRHPHHSLSRRHHQPAGAEGEAGVAARSRSSGFSRSPSAVLKCAAAS